MYQGIASSLVISALIRMLEQTIQLCMVGMRLISLLRVEQDSKASLSKGTAQAWVENIVVGGRHFWLFLLAGGPPYILYTDLVCD